MPVLLVWLGEMLMTTVGALALQMLVGVGVGLATYKLAVKPAESMIASYLSGGGDVLVNYVGWLGIDQAITIVFSALIGRTAIGAAKAFIVKK